MPEPVLQCNITGKRISLGDIPSSWLLFGQHRFVEDGSLSDYLVPSYQSRDYSYSFGDRSFSGRFNDSTMPSDTDLESLISIGKSLCKLTESGASFAEWLKLPPIEPNISDNAQLLPLDLSIENDLPALEALFSRPRSDIETIDESTPVSRVRRPSVRAAQHLASHTEDWERVGLKGVEPKRILARIRVENFAIYENCVMVRLADNLIFHLLRRIDLLRKILRSYEESCDMASDLDGTRFRQDRVARIWGELFSEGIGGEWIRENLNRLEECYYRLVGLKNYPLYQAIPLEARVPRELKNSNILTNDPLYRTGAHLWIEWRKKETESELSLDEQKAYQQQVCQAMGLFCQLLCLRALKNLLPWIDEQIAQKKLVADKPLDIKCESWEFQLLCDSQGLVKIRYAGHELRVIGIPANLSGLQAKEDALRVSDLFRCSAKEARIPDTLILHLEDVIKKSDSARWFNSVGNYPEAEIQLPPGVMVMGVSPLSIGSVEKVGRALRWFFAQVDLSLYPLRFNGNGETDLLREFCRDGWLKEQSGAFLVCDMPRVDRPLAGEMKKIQQQITTLSRNVEDIEKQRDPRNRRKGEADKEKADLKKLKQELDTATKRKVRIRDISSNLEKGFGIVKKIRDCPTCPNGSKGVVFQARDNDCYSCACPSCGSEWGIRRAHSGVRYPVLIPGGVLKSDSEGKSVDRLYGADILSLPDGQGSFLVPENSITSD